MSFDISIRIFNYQPPHRGRREGLCDELVGNAMPASEQKGIHAIVRDRWQSSGVFETIMAAFAPLGYRAVFAGFEKLFVFPAEKCSFYPQLEDFGIRKSDRFPYPGTLFFTLMPKP